ncbi:uncharacterized protein LOC8265394 [Ricinus communis]|uniref:Molybdopterin cofactor sulfurase, putative n=1 Tax=Ricinus communis TaxID=3988 RepID=B9RC09_RICCO|nr:uncharacterized protein LOC8265394 [Ricinus communis]EEF51080.1 molybdopterin cofactor sulfurase, putative [Ricinus communis]|eukprot:XP_002509693.1 uncharacterized protein LOC8265394 [Ricinus communis]
MHSPCIREASEVCSHGCCPTPFLGFPQPQTATSATTAASSRYDFEVAMTSSIYPNSQFTNHESLPSLDESFSNFTKAFPQYALTDLADKIRAQEYYHLSLSNHVCLDYIGHGLFSYSQQASHYQASPIASTSTSPPPSTSHSTALEPPFFDIFNRSVTLNSQLQYGGPESDMENKIRRRIIAFMNISEDEYTVVFTANQTSAFKLLADAYPFQSHRKLLTMYDNESEAVKVMIESSKQKGGQVFSADFSWPSLRIQSGKLKKKVVSKRKTERKKKRGLFVFPLQSRMTGTRYSYFWMSMAQENGWHILLDACALGPKEMETLGLSLFKPDFLICSFFKVFGENPSGFGCLFVKKSSASVLMNSTTAASIGIVRLVPAIGPSQFSEESFVADVEIEPKENLELHNDKILQGMSSKPASGHQMSSRSSEMNETEETTIKQKESEIEELETPPTEFSQFKFNESGGNGKTVLEFKGLEHADSLGLILISTRARYLINWLVNALMSLQHPHSENGNPLIRIYGPKIKFDRGPAVAFNIFDWKGERIDPVLVQKLADRNNISLSYGFLHHIWLPAKHEEQRGQLSEMGAQNLNEKREKQKPHSGISAITATLGFLTNFEDVYRLWAFVSRFLDADFVEKERWRYTALNQKTIEV